MMNSQSSDAEKKFTEEGKKIGTNEVINHNTIKQFKT